MSDGRTKYGDIIDHEHHVSQKRPQMSRLNRAAQFSPFAALTGYDNLVAESARVTDTRKDLTEDEIETLNAKLNLLQNNLNKHPVVTILHFVEDGKKAGGSYIETEGVIRKIQLYERILIMESGAEIPLDNIVDLSSRLFRRLAFSEGETIIHD